MRVVCRAERVEPIFHALPYAKGGALISGTVAILGRFVKEYFELDRVDQTAAKVASFGLFLSSLIVHQVSYKGIISRKNPDRALGNKIEETTRMVAVLLIGTYFCVEKDPVSQSLLTYGLIALTISSVFSKLALKRG